MLAGNVFQEKIHQKRNIHFPKKMVYYYKNILAFENRQWIFISQMQLQLPGLKCTAPEQDPGIIAGPVMASTLLFSDGKGKADV